MLKHKKIKYYSVLTFYLLSLFTIVLNISCTYRDKQLSEALEANSSFQCIDIDDYEAQRECFAHFRQFGLVFDFKLCNVEKPQNVSGEHLISKESIDGKLNYLYSDSLLTINYFQLDCEILAFDIVLNSGENVEIENQVPTEKMTTSTTYFSKLGFVLFNEITRNAISYKDFYGNIDKLHLMKRNKIENSNIIYTSYFLNKTVRRAVAEVLGTIGLPDRLVGRPKDPEFIEKVELLKTKKIILYLPIIIDKENYAYSFSFCIESYKFDASKIDGAPVRHDNPFEYYSLFP